MIIPNHVHFLIKPGKEFNISKMMQTIKINSSRDINKIIFNKCYFEGEKSIFCLQNYFLLRLRKKLYQFQSQFHQKYGQNQPEFPYFKWQQSFYNHIIRNQKDFNIHLNYIFKNPQKHNICEC